VNLNLGIVIVFQFVGIIAAQLASTEGSNVNSALKLYSVELQDLINGRNVEELSPNLLRVEGILY